MKKIVFLISLFACNYCFSQSITLKVLGTFSYTEKCESQGVVVILEENPNKCDPVLGFVSIEDQLKHLSESIQAKGSKSKLIPIKNYTYTPYRKQTFRFEEPDAELFNEILSVFRAQRAKVKRFYYKFPSHDYLEEDNKAIAALQDAKEKAELISNHLNYKVTRILNVDDNTLDASNWFELYNLDVEEMEKVEKLVQKYSALAGSKESYTKDRPGKYNLWVTFEINPL